MKEHWAPGPFFPDRVSHFINRLPGNENPLEFCRYSQTQGTGQIPLGKALSPSAGPKPGQNRRRSAYTTPSGGKNRLTPLHPPADAIKLLLAAATVNIQTAFARPPPSF